MGMVIFFEMGCGQESCREACTSRHKEDGTQQNIKNLAAARAQCIFNALGFEILTHECNRATSLGFETI